MNDGDQDLPLVVSCTLGSSLLTPEKQSRRVDFHYHERTQLSLLKWAVHPHAIVVDGAWPANNNVSDSSHVVTRVDCIYGVHSLSVVAVFTIDGWLELKRKERSIRHPDAVDKDKSVLNTTSNSLALSVIRPHYCLIVQLQQRLHRASSIVSNRTLSETQDQRRFGSVVVSTSSEALWENH